MPPTAGVPPRVAVVGCGAWGRNHVRTFKALGALGAVADTSPAAADAAAESASVPACSFDDILGDSAIAGVVIAAPDALHAEIARQVLDAGKHALVEKPMAMSVADANDLAARARERGLVLMTGHILLYHAAFRRLRETIAEGLLGKPLHIAARRLHWAPGAPRHTLWDLCPHDLSMILALTGRLPAYVRALVTARAGTIPQAGAVHLDFGDGLDAEISFSAISPVKLHQLTVSGDRAQAVFEDSRPWPEKLAVVRPGLDAARGPLSRDAVELTPGEPLADEARAFLAAMAGGPEPKSAASEAIPVIRVLAAAARAIESGKPETP
jgi:predicted dehydrogenase